MQCPDCKSLMRKHGAFYTCTRCGLSFKPWEVDQANQRAKDELEDLQEANPDTNEDAKKKKLRRYRHWYEGRQEVD